MIRYLRAAFFLSTPVPGLGNIPWNVVAVATATALGFVHPGFWLLGLGLESGYLLTLSTNTRFQRLQDALGREDQRQTIVAKLLTELPTELRAIYDRLADIVTKVTEVNATHRDNARFALADDNTFADLLVIALRLLTAKRQLSTVVTETNESALRAKIADLQAKSETDEAVRQSQLATLDLTQRRLATLQRNHDFLRRIDADLERIESQLTLALEEASSSGGHTPDLTVGLDLAGRLMDAGVYGDSAEAVAALTTRTPALAPA